MQIHDEYKGLRVRKVIDRVRVQWNGSGDIKLNISAGGKMVYVNRTIEDIDNMLFRG